MLTLTFLVQLAGVLVAAVVLHELTHYLVGRALGLEIWIAGPTTIRYRVEESVPRSHYRIFGLAPQAVGITVAVNYLVRFGLPDGTSGVLAAAGWLLYVWGSWEDVSVDAQRGETPWPKRWWARLPKTARVAYLGAGLAFTATGVAIVGGVAAGGAGVLLENVAAALLLGAIGTLVLAANE